MKKQSFAEACDLDLAAQGVEWSNVFYWRAILFLPAQLLAVLGILYQLVRAIPLEESDREEIYPADFSTALLPLPQRTNWQADRLERWRRRGWQLCGVSHAALHGHASLKLRDFSEPARLLFRYGRYEVVTRQQAASLVRDILTITSELADLPAIETRLALYLWGRLTPLETQQVLKRIGRLYKNSCWWSKKGARRLFDKAWASSDKKRWVTQQDHLRVRLDAPEDGEAAKWRQVAMHATGRYPSDWKGRRFVG